MKNVAISSRDVFKSKSEASDGTQFKSKAAWSRHRGKVKLIVVKIKYKDEVCGAASCNFVRLLRAGKFSTLFHAQFTIFFCFFFPFFHISLITFNYKIWKKDLLRDYHGVSEQFVDDLLNLLSVENAHAYRWDMSSVRESSLFCDNFKIWNFNMLFFSTATSNARK